MSEASPTEPPDEKVVSIKQTASRKFFLRLTRIYRVKWTLKQVNLSLIRVTSILVRSTLIMLFIGVVIYLYREFTDQTYHIQEFHVPQRFVEMGYNGNVVARQLQKKIVHFTLLAKATWSQNEIEEYNQSSDRTQVQVELGGLGFTPQSLVKSLKHFFGVQTKEITGDLIIDNSKLVLLLNLNDRTHSLTSQIVDSNLGKALDVLVKDCAQKVLEVSNPLLLGIAYGGNFGSEDVQPNDSIAIEMFRRTIGKKPDQAATGYAWWANSIIRTSGDTVLAMTKIKKALEIDSENAFAYRTWASIKFRHDKFDEGEKLLKKSLTFDPSSGTTWAYLGRRYKSQSGKRDIDAIDCFKHAIEVEPENNFEFDLAEILFYTGKYQEAKDIVEDEENDGSSGTRASALRVAALNGLGDSIQLKIEFESQKKQNAEQLSNALNIYSFQLGKREQWDLAFSTIALSMKADSSNGYVYSTLGELRGLKGDDEGFYKNIEKAISLGLSTGDFEDAKVEPYRTYVNQERYKTLKEKHSD